MTEPTLDTLTRRLDRLEQRRTRIPWENSNEGH